MCRNFSHSNRPKRKAYNCFDFCRVFGAPSRRRRILLPSFGFINGFNLFLKKVCAPTFVASCPFTMKTITKIKFWTICHHSIPLSEFQWTINSSRWVDENKRTKQKMRFYRIPLSFSTNFHPYLMHREIIYSLESWTSAILLLIVWKA